MAEKITKSVLRRAVDGSVIKEDRTCDYCGLTVRPRKQKVIGFVGNTVCWKHTGCDYKLRKKRVVNKDG